MNPDKHRAQAPGGLSVVVGGTRVQRTSLRSGVSDGGVLSIR